MSNADYTITSPLAFTATNSRPLLGLTIAWHPDTNRIGEQFVGTTEAGTIELSRFTPAFSAVNGDPLPVGYSGISRDPLRIVRDAHDGITICPPNSRMVVEINGEEIREPRHFSAEQIDLGTIIALGRAVFVCIHWMRCLPKHNPVDNFLGVGSNAIFTRDLIRLAATNDNTVLLLGETGTGKEVAAQAIHNLSKRSASRMVSVNMAALNESLAAADLFGASKGAYTGAQSSREGYFSEAQNSTLFLDEIGNTPSTVQPMLLRVLENGEYRPLGATRDARSSARLITATDQDLYHTNFNHALVRRLESFIIRIPPLRARREDIGLLICHLAQRNDFAQVNLGLIPPGLISDMLNFEWPGNIRQLSNVLKRTLLSLQMGEYPQLANMVEAPKVTVMASAELRKASFTGSATPPSKIEVPLTSSASREATEGANEITNPIERKKLRDLTEQDVIEAMHRHDWTIQYAADDLGISRPSMYKLIDANSQIRRVEQIPAEEIREHLDAANYLVEQCAASLKTPSEALRRHLKGLGWIA
ncbi:sigma 54-interacting transcriptional regulator [Undibacterium flavidum]|uniref:Sigma-54-dependent Fis family transcriptional regulator n=1 Tax=Undibacterium flavidum TaxID=2762297 RepID=A0ABR6Y848_9BURK|nr:sigma 54-interacting transcriptional regulator [Undibacterium flavidum]MBC3872347.1 sigma-54-dependent Fis family transcriptional regulator [Undibacterium flavidum]